jgi:transcriptional regulator with XRE-family HTH domain
MENTFGERIKQLRKSRKLSQSELAEIIGVGKSAISTWELNQNTPDSKYINKMADFFNVTQQELQYGSKPEVIHAAPEGFINIPISEYIEFLRYKSQWVA